MEKKQLVVLVVEDEEQILKTYENCMAEKPVRLVMATTVREAKEVFFNDPGRFDLIVLDGNLPDGDTIGLSEEMRRIFPPERNIIATSGREETQRELMAAGRCNISCPKPEKLIGVVLEMENLLAKQTV